MRKLVCNAIIIVLLLTLLGCNESTKSSSGVAPGTANQDVPQGTSKCKYLVRSDHGEEVVGPEGKVYQVLPGIVEGNFDDFIIAGDKVRLAGWVAEVGERNRPVLSVVVFMGGKCVGFSPTMVDRPDVADHFKNPALKQTGFNFTLPLVLFENERFKDFRIIALTKDQVAGHIKTDKANQGENGSLWMKTTTPK